MQTREIPANEWEQFFQQCSERHRGQPVTVEAVGGSSDAVQATAFEQPLVRIADMKSDAGDRIEVVAGEGEAKCHVVSSPTHVTVYEEGDSSLIEIDGSDGRSTRVRFGAGTNHLPPGNAS